MKTGKRCYEFKKSFLTKKSISLIHLHIFSPFDYWHAEYSQLGLQFLIGGTFRLLLKVSLIFMNFEIISSPIKSLQRDL